MRHSALCQSMLMSSVVMLSIAIKSIMLNVVMLNVMALKWQLLVALEAILTKTRIIKISKRLVDIIEDEWWKTDLIRYDNKNKRDLSLMEHHALKMGLAILTKFPFAKVGISIYCYISCNFITYNPFQYVKNV